MVAGASFGSSKGGISFSKSHVDTGVDGIDLDSKLSAVEANPDLLDVIAVDKLGVDVEIDEEKAHAALRPSYYNAMVHSPFLIITTLIAALGGFLFGYDTGVINGVQVFLDFNDAMGLTALTREDPSGSRAADLLGWITSCLVLACAFASPFAGPISDKIGRKWCIVSSNVVVCIGGIIQASALSWGMMIGGRICVGLGIGILSTTIPMYVSEMSPKSIRGSLGVLFQLAITIGLLVAFLVDLAFEKASHQVNDWRYALGTQSGLSMALFALMLILPESPRWLISQGQEERARAVLKRVRWVQTVGKRRVAGNNSTANAADAYSQQPVDVTGSNTGLVGAASNSNTNSSHESQYQYEDITNIDLEYLDVSEEVSFYKRFEDSNMFAYWKCFKPSVVLRTMIGICLQFFQQLTGINAIFYYSSTVFVLIGADPMVGTAITGAVNVAATFIAVFSMDRVGRRALLLYGAAGMAVCLAIVGILVLTTDPSQHGPGNAIIAFICLFIVNFAYSWGPIAWIIPAEIFPINVRAKGIALSTMSNWLANFAIAKSVPSLVLPSGFGVGGTFLFFAGFAVLEFFWVMTHIHETSGITLEKMNEIFDVDTPTKYLAYVKHNFTYFFHFGNQSMADYTDQRSGRNIQAQAQAQNTVDV